MKKLVNLKGAKALNRKEQKEIFGGDPIPHGDGQGGGGGGSGGGGCWVSCTNGEDKWAVNCDGGASVACFPFSWTICTC